MATSKSSKRRDGTRIRSKSALPAGPGQLNAEADSSSAAGWTVAEVLIGYPPEDPLTM